MQQLHTRNGAIVGNAPVETEPTLSIVAAAYNEEYLLQIFYERVRTVLDQIGESYEIVCLNDGNRDPKREMLDEAHFTDLRITVIHLSRNFGKELALTAGLHRASEQAVVSLDANLQVPPELIFDFTRLGCDARNVGDCHLIDSRIAAAPKLMRDHDRVMRGLFARVGYRRTSIGDNCSAGITKFNFGRLRNFATDGISGFDAPRPEIDLRAGQAE